MADLDMDRDTKRVILTGSPFTAHDEAIMGSRAMQLRWVVQDQLDLRRVASILREFANRLEVLSDPRHLDQRLAIIAAKTERKFAQDRLASKPKRR